MFKWEYCHILCSVRVDPMFKRLQRKQGGTYTGNSVSMKKSSYVIQKPLPHTSGDIGSSYRRLLWSLTLSFALFVVVVVALPITFHIASLRKSKIKSYYS